MQKDGGVTHSQRGSRLIAWLLGNTLPWALALSLANDVQTQTQVEAASQNSAATSEKASQGLQKRWNEIGIWGSVSFDAPTLIGKTPDARFGNVGVRYGRVLLTSRTVAFEWTIDAVPMAILSSKRFVALPEGGFILNQARKSVHGWGTAPIGLKFNFRRNCRGQPFAHATGGFLYFNEAVPESNAARFNFTFDFAGGIQIVNSSRRAFIIGYKYQHISNGNRALVNPGTDVQMIYAGFSVFK